MVGQVFRFRRQLVSWFFIVSNVWRMSSNKACWNFAVVADEQAVTQHFNPKSLTASLKESIVQPVPDDRFSPFRHSAQIAMVT